MNLKLKIYWIRHFARFTVIVLCFCSSISDAQSTGNSELPVPADTIATYVLVVEEGQRIVCETDVYGKLKGRVGYLSEDSISVGETHVAHSDIVWVKMKKVDKAVLSIPIFALGTVFVVVGIGITAILFGLTRNGFAFAIGAPIIATGAIVIAGGIGIFTKKSKFELIKVIENPSEN